jgi:hypothetical protein
LAKVIGRFLLTGLKGDDMTTRPWAKPDYAMAGKVLFGSLSTLKPVYPSLSRMSPHWMTSLLILSAAFRIAD